MDGFSQYISERFLHISDPFQDMFSQFPLKLSSDSFKLVPIQVPFLLTKWNPISYFQDSWKKWSLGEDVGRKLGNAPWKLLEKLWRNLEGTGEAYWKQLGRDLKELNASSEQCRNNLGQGKAGELPACLFFEISWSGCYRFILNSFSVPFLLQPTSQIPFIFISWFLHDPTISFKSHIPSTIPSFLKFLSPIFFQSLLKDFSVPVIRNSNSRHFPKILPIFSPKHQYPVPKLVHGLKGLPRDWEITWNNMWKR